MAVMAPMISRSRSLPPIWSTKLRSIFRMSTLSRCTWARVEYPVPKSSRASTTPSFESTARVVAASPSSRGFSVLGVPCNQFGQQEPGSPQEIATFCSTTYGVTFPMTEKIDVNGAQRHPLYQRLTAKEDGEGQARDVHWNFEKFLVSPAGDIVARFRPEVGPDAAEVVSAVESVLPA